MLPVKQDFHRARGLEKPARSGESQDTANCIRGRIAGIQDLAPCNSGKYEKWDNAVVVNFTALYTASPPALPLAYPWGGGGGGLPLLAHGEESCS